MRPLALVTAGILALGACGPAPAAPSPAATPTPAAVRTPAPTPSPTPAPVAVKYGQIGGVSDAAIFIADAKGFYKAQGIVHEPQPFGSAAQMVAPLGTGELTVGGGAPSAGLFNAVDRGVQLRIVADKGSLLPGFGYEAIIVRKDLADKVKSAKDFKGLKVSIDVAAPIEPHVTRILDQGLGVLLTRTDAIVPNEQTAVILYSEKFAQQRDLAIRWMVAYIQGARFFNDAFGPKKDAAKRKEAIEILSKGTKIDAALFEKMVLAGINPDGKVNVASLAEAQKYFVAKGTQAKAIDLSKVVDLTFAEEAVKRLGPYR